MVAFVQQASNTGGTPLTVTLGANTTAGNCLVVCIALGSGSSHSVISGITLGGAAGNFAQLAAVGDLTTGAEQLAVWADPNCAGGQTSVVITRGTGDATVLLAYVFEFSGVVSSSPLDQSATFDSGGGTNSTFSVTTGTTVQATEVAVGCVYGFNTTITGPSSPWVNEPTITSTTRTLQAGYDILSSTGTVTYSGSFGAAEFNGQIVVTLKGTAAAGVNGTVQPLATIQPRRRTARGVWGGVRGPAFVAVAAPRQEPPIPRRTKARGVWAGSKPFPGFVAVAAPPRLPPVPRRTSARGVWGAPVRGPAFVAVAAPPLLRPVPRRYPARAVWAGLAAPFRFGAAPRQLPPVPRRYPARAVVQFTPVTTTNQTAAPVSGALPVVTVNRTEIISRVTGRVVRR